MYVLRFCMQLKGSAIDHNPLKADNQVDIDIEN
jgi:hypothetical protein